MKYKVGDKVKVRSDLRVGKSYGEHIFVHDMFKFMGKIVTIESVWEQGYRILRHFRRANGMACKPGGYAGRRLGNRGVKEGAHHGYYDHH